MAVPLVDGSVVPTPCRLSVRESLCKLVRKRWLRNSKKLRARENEGEEGRKMTPSVRENSGVNYLTKLQKELKAR